MGADYWAKRASGLLVPRVNFGQPLPCPACCDPPCLACLGGGYPENVQVAISGIADDASTYCDELNGTYSLPYVESEDTPPTCEHRWRDTFTQQEDEYVWVQLYTLYNADTRNGRTHVTAIYYDGVVQKTVIGFRDYLDSPPADPPDCSNWSSFDLPFYSDPLNKCDTDSAACAITAL
jgi:hypothetical protein